MGVVGKGAYLIRVVGVLVATGVAEGGGVHVGRRGVGAAGPVVGNDHATSRGRWWRNVVLAKGKSKVNFD
jgi:hypothetical protein